jgi:hypothetical protein
MDFKMKRYNKPVVEINGFEVEDIIAVSVAFSSYGEDAAEMQAVYKDFVGAGNVFDDDQSLLFEWFDFTTNK